MNKVLLSTVLISVSLSCFAQVHTAEIETMFSTKDDVDFLLVSESGGESSYCKYYIHNDTLYEVPTRMIALADINFSSIDYYKNVFNTLNNAYPWVLVIKPAANKYSYYYGFQDVGEIDLYLPSQTFAEETYDYLKEASQHNGAIHADIIDPTQISPAEICKSTVNFMNDLMTTNLNAYIGEMISSDLGFTFYNSLIPFPSAVKTMIQDTNGLQPDYRSAQILMMTETQYNENISDGMKKLYDQLCEIFKQCLGSNGFTYENKDDQWPELYKLQSDFTHYFPSDNTSPFADLQTKRGLIVHVRVLQNKNESEYTNQLYIYFIEQ